MTMPRPRNHVDGALLKLYSQRLFAPATFCHYLSSGQKSLLASIMSSRTSLATFIEGTVLLSVKALSAFSYEPST